MGESRAYNPFDAGGLVERIAMKVGWLDWDRVWLGPLLAVQLAGVIDRGGRR